MPNLIRTAILGEAGHNPLLGDHMGAVALTGYREELTDKETPYDIWDGPDVTQSFLDAPSEFEVVSTSAADTADGDGIRRVRCLMHLPDYTTSEQFIDMNGTTPVTVPGGPYIRGHYMRAASVGPRLFALGTIMMQTVGGIQTSRIPENRAISASPFWTIPARQNGMITDFVVQAASAKKADFISINIYVREFEGDWFPLSTTEMSDGLTKYVSPQVSPIIPQRTDMRVVGIHDGDNVKEVSCAYTVLHGASVGADLPSE